MSFVPRLGQPAREFEPLDLNGLRITCYRQWPDEAFVREWEAFAARMAAVTTFHTPAWQAPLLSRAERTGAMRLIAVRRGARLVGVIPLQAKRKGMLESPGSLLSDYADPLIDPAEEAAVWPEVLAFLSKLPGGFSGLMLHNVRHDVPCRPAIAAACRQRGFGVEDAGGVPFRRSSCRIPGMDIWPP